MTACSRHPLQPPATTVVTQTRNRHATIGYLGSAAQPVAFALSQNAEIAERDEGPGIMDELWFEESALITASRVNRWQTRRTVPSNRRSDRPPRRGNLCDMQ